MRANRRSRAAISATIVLAAVVGATLSTSARMVEAPRAWAGPAAIVLVVFACALPGRRPRRFDGLLALALGALAGHRLLEGRLLNAHDAGTHLWGIWAYRQAWLAGDWFPAWLHHLGLGQPFPLFYGGAAFYAAAPLALAGLSTQSALMGSLVLFGALASLSMAWVVGRATGDRRAALVAAAAYAFAPYRLLDTDLRAAFSECAAFAVTPLFFFAAERALRTGSRRAIVGTAAAAALLAWTHPLTLIMASSALLVWWICSTAIAAADLADVRRRLGRLVAAGLLGAGLAGFFLVPLIFESGRLAEGAAIRDSDGTTRFEQNGLPAATWLERRLWDHLRFPSTAASNPQARDAASSTMPCYAGWALLAALPLAGIALNPRRASSLSRRWVLPAAISSLACLTLSAGAVAPAIGRIPPLAVLQFPWRFLALFTCLAIMAGGAAVPRLISLWSGRRPWPRRAAYAGLAALAILDGLPFTGLAGLGDGSSQSVWSKRHAPWRVAGNIGPPDLPTIDTANIEKYSNYFTAPVRAAVFDPARSAALGAGLRVLPNGRSERLAAAPYATWASDAGAQALPFTRGGGRIRVDLGPLGGRGGHVDLLEQYFPGWEERSRGEWREIEPAASGLLQANVPPGATELLLRFDRFHGVRLWGWLATLTSAVAAIALMAAPRTSSGYSGATSRRSTR